MPMNFLKPIWRRNGQTTDSRTFCPRTGYVLTRSTVQQQVAEKMLRLLTEQTPDFIGSAYPPRFRHIAEFGCGTGSYSRILLHRLQPESLLLNDLCPEMKECLGDLLLQDTVQFMPGDAEVLDFPEKTDLITSCSTLQWFSNPEKFFARCHGFLADDGYLAFSTFGMENMREIHALTGHGLDYLPIEKLKELLCPYFETVYAEEEIVTLPFATPLQVLQHLKQTGVTGTEKKYGHADGCRHFVTDIQKSSAGKTEMSV